MLETARLMMSPGITTDAAICHMNVSATAVATANLIQVREWGPVSAQQPPSPPTHTYTPTRLRHTALPLSPFGDEQNPACTAYLSPPADVPRFATQHRVYNIHHVVYTQTRAPRMV